MKIKYNKKYQATTVNCRNLQKRIKIILKDVCKSRVFYCKHDSEFVDVTQPF